MVEGVLVAIHKTQSNGKFLKNYPPCQHYGKNGHPPYKCWKRTDAQCKNNKQLVHEAVICKSKFKRMKQLPKSLLKKKTNTYLWKLIFQPNNLIF